MLKGMTSAIKILRLLKTSIRTMYLIPLLTRKRSPYKNKICRRPFATGAVQHSPPNCTPNASYFASL